MILKEKREHDAARTRESMTQPEPERALELAVLLVVLHLLDDILCSIVNSFAL